MEYSTRISIWFGFAGIILALIAIFFGPQIWYSIFGSISINYNANYFTNINGIDYAQIEVLNNLGHSLEYVNGTVVMECSSLNFDKISETFKLGEGKEFLPQGDSNLLFAPDPFLVNLAKTKDFECSDAEFRIADYTGINKSYSKLDRVYNFKFFSKKDNITVIKEDIAPEQAISSRICIECNMRINIYTKESNNFSKKETSKFVSGKSVTIFPEIHQIPQGYSPNFSVSHLSALYSFPLCKNFTEPCSLPLCNFLKERYSEFKLECNSSSGFTMRNPYPFENHIFTF